MKTFLIVLFLVNGEPALLDGWMPLEVADLSTCEIGALNVLSYIAQLGPALPPTLVVDCVEADNVVDAVTSLLPAP